jgi:hypothetical protein
MPEIDQMRCSDEEIIRGLVQAENSSGEAPKFTDNVIYVSGAYPQPLTSLEQLTAARTQRAALNQPRPNESSTCEIGRLVVAEARDMAYEFGKLTLRWDSPAGHRTGLDATYVRIWRKLGGEWMVEVSIVHPHRFLPQ